MIRTSRRGLFHHCRGWAVSGMALVVIAIAAHCGQASAAIYWGETTSIGRMNNDGGGSTSVTTPSIANACGVAVDGSHLYWGDKEHGTIGRANIDGSEPSYAFVAGASQPCGVAVDASFVYWANQGTATIGRARLDGSEVRQDFIKVPTLAKNETDAPGLCGLAVNGTHLFWANWREGLIGRARLDGEEVIPNLVGDRSRGLCGVAVSSTHLYWGGYGDEIGRANLDGSEPNFNFLTGLTRPCAVAVYADYLYWITEWPSFSIGRANLDGSSLTVLASDLWPSCGLAVNSLFYPSLPPVPTPPKPAPTPEPTACKLGAVRHNRPQGKVFVAVRTQARSRIEVITRGLGWRVLGGQAVSTANPNPRQRWVAVWAGDKGKAARRIGKRLAQDGRARLDLRIRCRLPGAPRTTTSRSLALLAIPANGEERRSGRGR